MMSSLRALCAVLLALFLLPTIGCHRQELRFENDDEGGPTSIVVQRFEITGTFQEIASAAQAAITGQGGPSAVFSEGQVRFRNRSGRLTLRQGEDNSIRVELVLRLEASVGEQQRWQQWYRAIASLRGIGRRIVNGQPVE
jgi:hypothetical protein